LFLGLFRFLEVRSQEQLGGLSFFVLLLTIMSSVKKGMRFKRLTLRHGIKVSVQWRNVVLRLDRWLEMKA